MSYLLPEQPQNDDSSNASSVRGKKWLQRSALTASALVATVVAGGAIYLTSIDHNIERADFITQTAAAAPQSAKGALNIVILGSASPDAVTAKTGKGSVVMVLHFSADRKAASLVSFPSATYVAIPGHGMGALSTTYALGGAKLTVQTLEKLLNTRMDHAMVADFDGFTALAQQVGSVTVDNPKAFRNAGHSFSDGKITLSPEEALGFIKSRENVADDAQAKAARQRLLLEAGLQKGLSRDTLSHPAKLNKFVRTATSNTTVDRDFTATAIAKIAGSLRLKSDDIELVRAPLADEVMTKDEAEVQKVEPVQFKALATAMSEDKLADYLAKYPSE